MIIIIIRFSYSYYYGCGCGWVCVTYMTCSPLGSFSMISVASCRRSLQELLATAVAARCRSLRFQILSCWTLDGLKKQKKEGQSPTDIFFSSFSGTPGISRQLRWANRQSPIASVQRTRSTLAGHSAVPRGTNTTRMNANRAIRIAAQRTQGL